MLLDTHTLLWFVLNDKNLSAVARDVISTAANDIYVSPASYWEIAIKIGLGKYKLSIPYEDFWQQAIVGSRINVLPIEINHTGRLISLPFHHKDPFDRLLVAQSLTESIPLVSADSILDAYGIQRIW